MYKHKCKSEELIKHIDFLLSKALHKCRNLEDAKDLAQETMLAGVNYLANHNEIYDIKGWLVTVLNRKYYDRLRRKYKTPTVIIGNDFDIMDETNIFTDIYNNEDAESVRREVAYLTMLHREVIVRYYMNGDSIVKIAHDLKIPQGTVKSRLSAGREQIRKELDNMESYVKQSYEPIHLHISNSGRCGLNDEPSSITDGDLIAQNLLYLAYDNPIKEYDLSKAIGIPAAYLEPVIDKLVKNELMKQVGNKVYTDFLIYTIDDKERYIPSQKKLIADNFDIFWSAIHKGLNSIRNEEYYIKFDKNKRDSLELHFIMRCLDQGTFGAFSRICNAKQIMPDRPNGGKWIAFGFATPQDYNYKDHLEINKYSYSGERNTYIENYVGAQSLSLHVFDPGFLNKLYFRGTTGIWDDNLLKLLYIINGNINPEEIGFNIELLKSIPWLEECRIMKMESSGARVDIPVLTNIEYLSYCKTVSAAIEGFISDIYNILEEHLANKKKPIPKHLTSVPMQKQYGPAMGAINMAVIYNAQERGLLHKEEDYEVTQGSYPMVLVIEK